MTGFSTGAFLLLVVVLLLCFVSLSRPVAEIVQDICQGNWLRFGPGKLKELCKLLPEEREVTTAPLVPSQHYSHILCAEKNINNNN